MNERIRIEIDPTRNPVSLELAFHNCELTGAYGRTGITQDEDEVPLPLENGARCVVPPFFWSHYQSLLVALDCEGDAVVRVTTGDQSFDLRISDLTKGPTQYETSQNSLVFSADDAPPNGTIDIHPTTVRAGDPCRFHLRYRVGAGGISDGGAVRILSPFSAWSDPILEAASVRLSCKTGARLTASIKPHHWIGRGSLVTLQVTDGNLEDGDIIDLLYSAGKEGVRVQQYTQDSVFFKFMVDCDGKGDFRAFPDTRIPPVRVVSNRPRRIRLACPMIVKQGEAVAVTALILDEFYNPVFGDYIGALDLLLNDQPARRAELTNASRGKCIFKGITIDTPGLNVIRVKGKGLDDAILCVDATEEEPTTRLFWGQIHGHSGVSDGVGTADEYFAYGRDIGLLDVCALTDHEWEILEHYRNTSQEGFGRICEQANQYHRDGKYVVFPAYEWMMEGAHINVYYLDEDEDYRIVPGGVSMARGFTGDDAVTTFFSYYKGKKNVLLIPHSSHGFDWQVFKPDLMPVLEMYSMWGNSEFRCYGPGAADGLKMGYEVGFIGGGDNHHGRPGQTGRLSKYRILNCREGLAAFLAPELTRSGIGSSLRQRRTYATTGERIFLDFRINGLPMGSEIPAEASSPFHIAARVGGAGRIATIELLKNSEVIDVETGKGILANYEYSPPPGETRPGDYFYLRIRQTDGETAWSSPIWIGDGH